MQNKKQAENVLIKPQKELFDLDGSCRYFCKNVCVYVNQIYPCGHHPIYTCVLVGFFRNHQVGFESNAN